MLFRCHLSCVEKRWSSDTICGMHSISLHCITTSKILWYSALNFLPWQASVTRTQHTQHTPGSVALPQPDCCEQCLWNAVEPLCKVFWGPAHALGTWCCTYVAFTHQLQTQDDIHGIKCRLEEPAAGTARRDVPDRPQAWHGPAFPPGQETESSWAGTGSLPLWDLW